MYQSMTGNPSANMAQVMAKVRKMSDSQLADILSGKDVSVPQFAAMTEAMGRRQLRQAVDGAQAQQQAHQPSIKEQLLAEQQAPAGLDALPAPNMESMDMAGGGIIAFDKGGDVYDRWKALASDEGEGVNKLLDPVYGFFTNRYGQEAKARREEREKQAALKAVANTTFADDTIDPNVKQLDPNAPAPTAPAPAASSVAAKPNAAAPGAGISALAAAPKFERRASPFAGMAAEPQDYEKLKAQGLGEGLMKMGAGLLSAPGSKGFSAGIQALADSGAISRKEIAGLKKDARDYDLNIKKADAAFEQGNDELAYKYMQEANLTKYRMASLAQEPGELRTLKGIAANPELAAIYKGGKGAGVISRTDALKEWNDLPPGDKRKLQGLGVSDFNSYYSYLSTGLPSGVISATVPQGVKVRD